MNKIGRIKVANKFHFFSFFFSENNNCILKIPSNNCLRVVLKIIYNELFNHTIILNGKIILY
jgi:hypothetical protein